ncbi:MAG: hypothetical protein P0Y65_08530 [Candidatus Devosia phytovorans]|uniref:Uncharacterized protein n=1 Tax=Candidatus Devosia phytovorans TaxID=3121372 RepID=A0AAJ5VZD9_9HYPH|nr:hypothetical protein [Devosia sp.]WEK06274.1 MAG: hypothetical protein P0Y65_08530 [Devosia sp.]
MKLTWFGGTTIRIHIGGAILVVDANRAPKGIDARELVSGADRVIEQFGAELIEVSGREWKPRKPLNLIDEGGVLPEVELWSVGQGSILIDAMGETPLLLLTGEPPVLGRWAEVATTVLFGTGVQIARLGKAVLEDRPPRLLALAADEADVDHAIPILRELLDGSGLVSLEPGLALEV